MLTDKELKEIGKLSIELKVKVQSMFDSPFYELFDTVDTQIKAICADIKAKPYTIRGSGENENAKAEYDSMIKTMEKIDILVQNRERYRMNLTPEEQANIGRLTTTADIRKEALNGK